MWAPCRFGGTPGEEEHGHGIGRPLRQHRHGHRRARTRFGKISGTSVQNTGPMHAAKQAM